MKIIVKFILHVSKLRIVVRININKKCKSIDENFPLEKVPDCTELSSSPGSCYQNLGSGGWQDAVDKCNAVKGTMPRATALEIVNEMNSVLGGQIWVGLTTKTGA